jgi:TonB family protein
LGLLANALIFGLVVWVKIPSSDKPLRPPRIQMVSLSRLPEPVPAPAIAKPPMAPMKRPAPKARLIETAIANPARSIELPAPPSLSPAKVELKASIPEINTPSLPAPKPVLGTFQTTNPVPARIEREPVRIATGGFGNPAGALDRKPDSRSGIAQPSGFESAEAVRPGKSRMAVAQGEAFGSVEAAAPKPRSSGTLMASSFDASPISASQVRRDRQSLAESDFKGVEILSKPRPLYTEEARRLGIEGEVHLRILFGADGRLKVLTVVRGLGHGLDENAALAAAQIQFRPASKQGQAVEQAAIVRVQFQLAN